MSESSILAWSSSEDDNPWEEPYDDDNLSCGCCACCGCLYPDEHDM